ncbi:DUF4293 family protein [Elizabethkingia sp. JS20170427COW]|uniref:DUF4293 family protein n=1 Tax=Elizabethkingia sp. JS20170427COW TaxID=2583851 RepID=UPI001110CC41|nr:DUF4293 family protein [Elizabethkingia sp. JS20170427COW]QCX53289.1 DUF4293 family protein [Elizabethkingia sp. JS20170427COW]
MIQRIQTLWMFLALLASAFLLLKAPTVDILGSFPWIKILSGIIVLLLIFSIFSFRNRKRQILLNYFSIIINALLIGLLAFWLLSLPGGSNFPEKGIELSLPLFGIITLLFANVGISKDEKLVKSVDRFR